MQSTGDTMLHSRNRKSPAGTRPIRLVMLLLPWLLLPGQVRGDEFRDVPLVATLDAVQPQTGIVLWADNEAARTAPIQLEYSYLYYGQIVSRGGEYDWRPLEKLLDRIAGRGHQAIIRWHDTYVGKPAGVPAYIASLPDYRPTHGKSENKPTEFPDWSHPEWQRFVFEFFTRFAERYDRDPRLAFVQVGFGLWSEYHIYDGPMQLGKTFPSMEYQAEFARHLARVFRETHWMISVDAAAEWGPFAQNEALRLLPFGVFDDSFNHKRHKAENEPNWLVFGGDRWQRAPAGGEFSFFEKGDQQRALAPRGPHGIPFEQQAAKFHVSFIIGDDQPRFQTPERIRQAGQACGYRFRVMRLAVSHRSTRVEIENRGIAPLYYDAYPTVDEIRSPTSLKGLLPGEIRAFDIPVHSDAPRLSITSDRLVPGQRIGYEANLP